MRTDVIRQLPERGAPLLKAAVAGLLALVLAVGAMPVPVKAETGEGPTVYLASDSTVQTYDPYWDPQAGWGQMLDRFFTDEVTVENHAIGGRSSRTFVEEGRLQTILDEIQAGDYLFVQFGHNDSTTSRPERYTSPEDYKEILRNDYVRGAREAGAIPVLVTPVSRRDFDPETGKFNVSFPEYVQKVYELAAEENVLLVDLSASSRAYLDEIGPEEAKSVFLHVPPDVYPNRPNGTQDDTHFQEYGAIQMARLVAMDVAELDTPLAGYVQDTEVPAEVPPVPTGLAAESVSNESVRLVWDEVDGADIYRVRMREAGDPTAQWRLATTSTVGVGQVSGLRQSTSYEFHVVAVNRKGESAPSDTLTVTTLEPGWTFDFGPEGSVVGDGYTAMTRGTLYTAERGYGLSDSGEIIDRDRGDSLNDVDRDFIAWFGGRYEFKVDVPDGRYSVSVHVGDALGSARSNFEFEGVDYGGVSAPKRSAVTRSFNGILVEDGQLNTHVSGQTGHLNGLEITRTGDLPDELGDPDEGEPTGPVTRDMEFLDRSPVAVNTADGVYLSWRLLGLDDQDVAFHVYRDGRRITDEPLTAATNYLDARGRDRSSYQIATIVNGAETERTTSFRVWGGQALTIPVAKPAGGTTRDGVDYTYHLNDASVGDLDGDGRYEIVQMWSPSNAKDNSQAGYTGNVFVDAYTLSGERLWRIDMGPNIRAGAHYTSLSVYDFDSNGKAEVILKTGDGTVDAAGNTVGDADADWRNDDGYIITGPEYLTVFDGETGTIIDTVDYAPERGNICDWGDCYGNRGDRLMAAVAYLDGAHPSLITSRGIYTRSVIVAWDFDGENLVQRWTFDSDDWGPKYVGQGNHQMSIADVDGDHRDEIVYGAMTINQNGLPRYSSQLGHGDALHVSDLNPGREGQEIFSPFECMSCSDGVGAAMRDAATGEVLWGMPSTHDVGRAATGDIDPRHPGAEAWAVTADGKWNSRSGQLRTADGTLISESIPSANFMIWWDGDPLREILDHEFDPDAGESAGRPFIGKWDWEQDVQEEILSPAGVRSNNHTKGTPVLQADLLGDWREEVIWRSADDRSLQLFTTTEPTSKRLRTLMHDPQYRLAVAWQNESYNQPPHPSFFIGTDMEEPAAPDIRYVPAPNASEAVSCTVQFDVVHDGPGGFQTQVQLTNTGESTLDGWRLQWTFPRDETIRRAWNVEYTQNGADVTVTPTHWNNQLEAGATVPFGFRGDSGGRSGEPETFTLNGTECAVK